MDSFSFTMSLTQNDLMVPQRHTWHRFEQEFHSWLKHRWYSDAQGLYHIVWRRTYPDFYSGSRKASVRNFRLFVQGCCFLAYLQQHYFIVFASLFKVTMPSFQRHCKIYIPESHHLGYTHWLIWFICGLSWDEHVWLDFNRDCNEYSNWTCLQHGKWCWPILDTLGGYHHTMQWLCIIQCLYNKVADNHILIKRNTEDNCNYNICNGDKSVCLTVCYYWEAFIAILRSNVLLCKDAISELRHARQG